MSHVVSIRFKEEQMARLKKMARRLGNTVSETSALFVEEALRQAEFGYIEFRDSTVGRQAYIQGSGLAVWEIVMIARTYKEDVTKTAKHLGWPPYKVKGALTYAKAFPEEINTAILDNDFFDFQQTSQRLPQTSLFAANLKAKPQKNVKNLAG